MIRKIRRFFRWLKWLRDGKPVLTYPGYRCGGCGAWVDEEYTVPTYKSHGAWADYWDYCPKCTGEDDNDQKANIICQAAAQC